MIATKGPVTEPSPMAAAKEHEETGARVEESIEADIEEEEEEVDQDIL